MLHTLLKKSPHSCGSSRWEYKFNVLPQYAENIKIERHLLADVYKKVD